jgi:hypothetical protein
MQIGPSSGYTDALFEMIDESTLYLLTPYSSAKSTIVPPYSGMPDLKPSTVLKQILCFCVCIHTSL